MGSSMKKSIFDEQTSKALKKWREAVKNKKSSARTLGGSTVGSKIHSQEPKLHRFKTTGHSTRHSSYDDWDRSDHEAEPLSPTLSSTANLIVRVDHGDEQQREENEPQDAAATNNGAAFSIVKPNRIDGAMT